MFTDTNPDPVDAWLIAKAPSKLTTKINQLKNPRPVPTGNRTMSEPAAYCFLI
jgi:hypothetical protein